MLGIGTVPLRPGRNLEVAAGNVFLDRRLAPKVLHCGPLGLLFALRLLELGRALGRGFELVFSKKAATSR